MIKNIIFDWSGSLSDDHALVYEAIMRLFEQEGLPRISFTEFKREFALPYMKFYNKYSQNWTIEEIYPRYLKEIQKVGEPKLFTGVPELLKELFDRGLKMIVLSSVPEPKLIQEAKNNHLDQYFQELKGTVHDKIAVIDALMKKNNFKPAETAFIGDMTHDIDAGKKAGVTTIAVTWGYQTREQLAKAKPDYMIDRVKEIGEIVLTSFEQ